MKDLAKPIVALGFMSGTSMDGVDAALIETDGRHDVRALAALTRPYDADFRARLAAVVAGRADPHSLEGELTERHAEAGFALLREAGIEPRAVGVAGFHGQTIRHAPAERLTVQIGDGARLAERLGIDVVADFRRRDVAAGGEGAPLAPVYHAALCHTLPRPVAVLNIGGVANVTFVGAGDAMVGNLIAFDTGPGNALIDDWCAQHTGEPIDRDGRLARSGRVHAATLAHLLEAPFFRRLPPKSLDRNAFSLAPLSGLGAADGAATLVAFTASAVALGRAFVPMAPLRWLVAGGGRRNPAIMAALGAALGVAVEPIEAIGTDGDALEAQAFAYLAVRSLLGLPLSLPSTTGVSRPVTGGALHRYGATRAAD
ncbi:MAG: anhydro-N-acetylmuramic acid kinase [Alphaproteobacteria bacterium]|nr:anhydro-N-acetylmuramic acid kinase [Alphaproteobacteria bacterium]